MFLNPVWICSDDQFLKLLMEILELPGITYYFHQSEPCLNDKHLPYSSLPHVAPVLQEMAYKLCKITGAWLPAESFTDASLFIFSYVYIFYVLVCCMCGQAMSLLEKS